MDGDPSLSTGFMGDTLFMATPAYAQDPQPQSTLARWRLPAYCPQSLRRPLIGAVGQAGSELSGTCLGRWSDPTSNRALDVCSSPTHRVRTASTTSIVKGLET